MRYNPTDWRIQEKFTKALNTYWKQAPKRCFRHRVGIASLHLVRHLPIIADSGQPHPPGAETSDALLLHFMVGDSGKDAEEGIAVGIHGEKIDPTSIVREVARLLSQLAM